MSYPTVFANLAGGTQPASLLDTMFNICGNQGNIPCTAAGTNAITLTPNANFFSPASYVNYQMATFSPVNTSTGAVTLQIGALALLPVFNIASTQAQSGDLIAGETYTVVFNQAYNAGGGGFQIISAQGNLTNFIQGTPGGYLTLLTGTPIIGVDTTITSGNPIFYTPYFSTLVPIWSGAQFLPQHFSELQLVLDTTMLASNIYDVFVFNAAGTLTLGTGPSWTAGGGSITPGSCVRGTGAGSTALARTGGFFGGYLNNAVQITARNGVTNFTVAAGFGTYLGSIFMDTSNGQITCHRSIGQNRKWGVWNYYNRSPLRLQEGDSTASWNTTGTFTWRPSNNNTANILSTFTGVGEETVDIQFSETVEIQTTTTTLSAEVFSGVGINSTNTPTGFQSQTFLTLASVTGNLALLNNRTVVELLPSATMGINNITPIEQVSSIGASNTVTFFGTTPSMNLIASWRG